MVKRFVYVLKNHETPPRYYTGLSSDVPRRCVRCPQCARRPLSAFTVATADQILGASLSPAEYE